MITTPQAAEEAVVRFTGTGTSHAVIAGGGPKDGSLYGFTTRCGHPLTERFAWTEEPEGPVTCRRCLRALGAPR